MERKTLSLKRLIFKNTSVQALAQVLTLTVGLFSTMILSRYLGREAFGQLNYILAFYFFFLALNDFGIDTILVREVSKDRSREGEMIGSILYFKLALALFSIVAACAVISLMNFTPAVRQALYLYSLILPLLALQVPALIFQVVLNFKYPSMIGVVSKVFSFLVILSVVLMGYSLRALIIGYLATEVVQTVLLIKYSKKYIKPVYKWNFSIVRKLFRPSIVLGATMLLVGLINRFDFIMLERMTDFGQVGLYAAAYRVTGLIEILPAMVMGTVFPLMSRYASEDRARFRRIYVQSMIYLGILAIPMGIAVAYFSPLIIRILFGVNFSEAARGLSVLIWSTVCLYWAISAGNVLVSLGKEKFSFAVQLLAVILNIGLNFVFIPRWGFVGAAFATSVTYAFIMIFVNGLAIFFLRKVRLHAE